MNVIAPTSSQLQQRGRAGLQMLGAIQAYSSSVLLERAQHDFDEQPERAALTEEFSSSATPADWPDRLARARDVAERSGAYRFNRFFQRWVAEEQYRRAIPAVERLRNQLPPPPPMMSAPKRPSRLILDPSLKLPAWYAGIEWHLQVGGLDGFDLSAPLFTLGIGQHIFSRGGYAAVPVGKDIRAHRSQVIAQLRNREPQRVYDMGCGGSMTLLAARQQFPDAELIGGDLSATLLRNGFAVSEALGAGITFRQEDACAISEPDASVDSVISFAVYHEMPTDVAARTLREALRILKPGGQIVVSDPPPFRAVPPLQAVLLDWETENRAEPYFTEAAARDLPQMMRDIGFVDVSECALDLEHRYPWVTIATKSA
jgi:ubiquinone/menaquinone biosynthesis C-methylase UbiE